MSTVEPSVIQGVEDLSIKPVNLISMSADEGLEARETVLGQGHPFVSPP